MAFTDQDILEDLAQAKKRVAKVHDQLMTATGRAYHAKGRIARLWWEVMVDIHDSRLAKADDALHHLTRIARRRGLISHRSARRDTFADHF